MSTEKEENTNCYANSSIPRPTELDGGGRGLYFCIPECKNALYDKNKQLTKIGMFTFPDQNKNPELRKKWVSVISRFRRKSANDGFKITNKTRICEFHFKAAEIKVSSGIHRKTLLPGVIPSIFKFRLQPPGKKRKSPAKRILVEEISESSEYEESSNDDQDNDESIAEPEYEIDERIDNNDEIVRLQNRIQELEEEATILREENDRLKKRKFDFENISGNANFFKKVTGLDTEAFTFLYEFLNPGEKNENVKFYESGETRHSYSDSAGSKPGPKPKLNSKDQLFMFLIWLRTGITLDLTGWLFDVPTSTVSRHIITWSNFLYFSLGSIPIWPSKDMVTKTMPDSFKKTYPTTRCIIDATELFCQRPSSLTIQSALYSSYKHHVTYKGLVGIAPSGAITFVSQLYDGSISDKELVARCGILQKKLWNDNDSMADRGFTIEEELKLLNVKLNIPAFLDGRDRLTESEVKESQGIAAVRIHVERAIQRIKKFRQIKNEIPLTLHGSINQIWTVACLLCNFLPPLIQENATFIDD